MFRPAHTCAKDVTQSGTSITTERAVNAPIALAVLGNTTQVVEPPSANLLDQSLFYAYNNGRYATVTHNADGTVTMSGSYLMVANVSLPTGTYNFNCTKNCTAGTPTYRWLLHYTDGTNVSQTAFGTPITATKPVDLIYVYITTSASVTATVTFSEMMLNSGSTVLPYSPYGYLGKPTPDTVSELTDTSGVTITVNGTQIARSEVLRGIGTTRDVLDVTGGAVTRKIGKKVFDGTETPTGFTERTNTVRVQYAIAGKAANGTTTTRILCSHGCSTPDKYWSLDAEGVCELKNDTIAHVIVSLGKSRLTEVSTNGVKAWVAAQYAAGTPVVIEYVLATPETEEVSANAIHGVPGGMTLAATSSMEATIQILGN